MILALLHSIACSPTTTEESDNDTGPYVCENDQDTDGFFTNICDEFVSPNLLNDCDDTNPDIHPDSQEIWYDGVDQDCDLNDFDADYDNHIPSIYYHDYLNFVSRLTEQYGIPIDIKEYGDCDDNNPSIHPRANETDDDGIDSNCDGRDSVYATGCEDNDMDGYGSSYCQEMPLSDLTAFLYADNSLDCDDMNASINPDAIEVCDTPIDEDCDTKTGSIDGDNDC